MVVVIANDIPPAVRGRMKLWFIEPRPNIFVSGITDSCSEEVVDYLFSTCPTNSGLLVFQHSNRTPCYKIRGIGTIDRQIFPLNGMPLILEKRLEKLPQKMQNL